MQTLSALSLLAGCAPTTADYLGPPNIPCEIETIEPTQADRDAFEQMAAAAVGTWSVPWTDAPPAVGSTLEVTRVAPDLGELSYSFSYDGVECTEEEPLLWVPIDQLDIPWLGRVHDLDLFVLALRSTPEDFRLWGSFDLDELTPEFVASVQTITEGNQPTSAHWSFMMEAVLSLSYQTPDGGGVASRVATCDPSCETPPPATP